MKKRIAILIGIISGMLLFGQIVCASEIEAVPSTHSLHIRSDGINETIDAVPAYIYEGNSYFRLRDLGKIIGCRVEWNDYSKLIIIDKDNSVRDFSAITSVKPAEHILKNKQMIRGISYFFDLDCLNIDGYNYFKLRDLMYAMQFACGWNNDTKTIEIAYFDDYYIWGNVQAVETKVTYDPDSEDGGHLERYIQEKFDPNFKVKDYIIKDLSEEKYGYLGKIPGDSLLRFCLNVNGSPVRHYFYEIVCTDGEVVIILDNNKVNPDFDLEKAGGPELSDEDAKRMAIEADGYDDPVFDQEIERYFNMEDLAHYCLVKTRYLKYNSDGNDYYNSTQHSFLDHYQRD